LSVSILAVAAIAASLILVRIRVREDDSGNLPHAGENHPVKLPLDAMRAAGL